MEENVKSNFFIALSEKICKLQKEEGLKFSLTELAAKPEKKIQVGIIGQKEKTFKLSIEGKNFLLDNPEERKEGGRPVFEMEDMIIYLLIIANGGPVPGKLYLSGEKIFSHFESVVPT
jgi:hypothetical protein